MNFIAKQKNKKYIRKLQQSAENGDNEAMYDLAMIYIDGQIVPKDLDLAKGYLEKSANNGHLPSQIYLKTKNVINSAKNIIKTFDDVLKNTNFKWNIMPQWNAPKKTDILKNMLN